MESYVFAQKWQAYLASLGIQGILLGLNFYFPVFWHDISSVFAKLGLLLLVGVVLFCSSWFSYIFIVGQVYSQSWDIESRLLIQSTYRKELYDAKDYTDRYEAVFANNLSQQILDLYSKARTLVNEEMSPTDAIDWMAGRAVYTGSEFAASSEMITIIDAMESVAKENSTASEREQALQIVIRIRSSLESSADRLSAYRLLIIMRLNQASFTLPALIGD